MLTFNEFLLERAPADSSLHNTAYGAAYETATVLHIHEHTAAKNNKDPEYQAKIQKVRENHEKAMSSIPDHLKKRALDAARSSGDAYLKSLSDNHGMKPENIHEVHHTASGIDQHVGKKVNRAANPHDVVVKGKVNNKSIIHGASLKAKAGTASNNPINSFDKNSGLKTNVAGVWADHRKKYNLNGKSVKDIKQIRNNPDIVQANREAQNAAAEHHKEVFKNSSLEDQKHHLRHMLKLNKPDLEYDYVKGEGKGSAVPREQMPHAKAINDAKSFKIVPSSGAPNTFHIHDEKGNHIATIEHRTTHGSFISPQVNAKFGKME
jgi:hypothetical protein